MDWYRSPAQSGGFGAGVALPFGPEDGLGGIETEEIQVELIGAKLRAAGALTVGRGSRLSDYVNVVQGFFRLRDVTLLDRLGGRTDIEFPEVRFRLDDVELVAQPVALAPLAPSEADRIEKTPRRAIVMTDAHIIYGSVYLHEQASLAGFVDAIDPRFMPMTDVLLRSLEDREPAGRFPFALVRRSHIAAMASGETDATAAGDGGTEAAAHEPESEFDIVRPFPAG